MTEAEIHVTTGQHQVAIVGHAYFNGVAYVIVCCNGRATWHRADHSTTASSVKP